MAVSGRQRPRASDHVEGVAGPTEVIAVVFDLRFAGTLIPEEDRYEEGGASVHRAANEAREIVACLWDGGRPVANHSVAGFAGLVHPNASVRGGLRRRDVAFASVQSASILFRPGLPR
jgi:hypothetical protein